MAFPRSGQSRTRELQPSAVPPGACRLLRVVVRPGAEAVSRPGSARACLGLRGPPAQRPHARYGERLRAADPAGLRTVLQDRAPPAVTVRRATDLPSGRERPPVELALSADCAPDRGGVTHRGRSAAGADRHLPDVQLRHAAGDAGAGIPMNWTGIIAQLLAILIAALGPPLLTGWINMCRAWLQNKSAPPLLLPYRTLHKLFWKESVVAETASPLFVFAPSIVFSAMVLACGIVPPLSTDLPLAPAADAIALVGLFALARAFIALAAMDIGTAFGTLGARREMLIGFL